MTNCNEKPNCGFTLIELLITLSILSILSAVALPFVETTVIRTKELEMRSALREVRSAIDVFHDDWLAGRIAKTNFKTSADGFPKSLQVLVEGVEKNDAKGGLKYYLRRIPRDPFAKADVAAVESWAVRGYQDDPESTIWGGDDVYDIRSKSDRTALDGTFLKDW